VRHLTVTSDDGAVLAVQEDGPHDGPALLLLPGQANSHRWWTGLRESFEPTHRTISFDYRGTGATVAPESDWSTASFAEDAAQVLRFLNVTRADVYATSMGGRVAQLLAVCFPDLVRRLVLACTSPGGKLAVERSNAVRMALSDPDSRVRRETLIDLMYTPAWRELGRKSHLLGDPTMSPRAQALHLRASNGHDAAEQLSEITAPTLILHGDADLMIPVTNARYLAGHIPGATLETFLGGRHGFFDEFRDRVSIVIQRFLR
jgi:pimeloyl-ACP methyl ester carboxylesterase